MRWREIVVGAIVTLLITILAGIVVWFLTREPRTGERLTYSVQQLASLTGDQTTINVVVVRLSNEGTKAAHDVKGTVQFVEGLEITEAQIASSAGLSSGATKSLSQEKRELDIDIPTLAPTEVLSATLLVRGASHSDPSVGVRSSETVGTEADPAQAATERKGGISAIIATIVVAGALLLQGAIYFFRDRIRALIHRLTPFYADENNVAFLLAHKGLPAEAEKILSAKIFGRSSGPIELANYGLALGLLGKPDYDKYFKAAEGWEEIEISSSNTHLKAIIEFNRAAISISQGDLEEAEKYLSRSLAIEKQEILKYCSISDYIADARKLSIKIEEMIKTNRK
jgi:tetratricopeptide (TPR) repeat protein